MQRVLLYLGAFVVSVVAVRRGEGERWANGLAGGIAVVGALALAQRLFPGFASDDGIGALIPSAAVRLSYPLGYWNGLAIFLALALPLLLRIAVADGHPLFRGAGLAPIPALAVAIYLTSSRGGAVAAALGVVVFVALTTRRFAAVQALVVGAIGTAAALLAVTARPVLVDGPLDSHSLAGQGEAAALLIALACLLTGLVHAALAAKAPASLELPRAVPVIVAAVLCVVAVGVLLAADPGQRLEAFKAAPTGAQDPDFVRSHLFSGGGSGRWQFWTAAVDEFRSEPLRGGGAGSYEAWWAAHGSLAYFVRNAHSLWLETLGELGLVGLVLLATAFITGLVSAVRRLRGPAGRERQPLVAALAATVICFMAGAAVDWAWQLPVVALVAMVSLGLLTGPATAARDGDPVPAGRRRAVRAGAVAIGCAVLAFQVLVWLGDAELRRSRASAASGDLQAALDHAAAARAIQPWAAAPQLQLALVYEKAGDLPAARAHAGEAIDRDPSDWRLRIVSARLATKSADVPAARAQLRAARRLAPRSPLLATLDSP